MDELARIVHFPTYPTSHILFRKVEVRYKNGPKTSTPEKRKKMDPSLIILDLRPLRQHPNAHLRRFHLLRWYSLHASTNPDRPSHKIPCLEIYFRKVLPNPELLYRIYERKSENYTSAYFDYTSWGYDLDVWG